MSLNARSDLYRINAEGSRRTDSTLHACTGYDFKEAAVETQRIRTEETKGKKPQDHFARICLVSFDSLQVGSQNPILLPQAVKILDADAAAD